MHAIALASVHAAAVTAGTWSDDAQEALFDIVALAIAHAEVEQYTHAHAPAVELVADLALGVGGDGLGGGGGVLVDGDRRGGGDGEGGHGGADDESGVFHVDGWLFGGGCCCRGVDCVESI